jgi:hypothetical protein
VLTATVPDLDEVLTAEVVPLRLVVSDATDVTRLTVNGEDVTRADAPGTFLDTLRLALGLNPLFVAVYDADGNVAEDTLYAVHLPFGTQTVPALSVPRYEHTATALPDGRVLVAGGFNDASDARGDALVLNEQGFTSTPLPDLQHARAGHTATLLPDGRVLLLGGAVRDLTNEANAFVTEAELFDPATGTFMAVAQEGAPLRRYEHAALALEDDGRVFVYVYGGLEPGTDTLQPTGTLVVMALRDEGGTPTLETLSPPGGIGAFPEAFAHALLPLPPADGAFHALAVGTDVTDAARVPLALRLTFRPSASFSPFEVSTEALAPPAVSLGQFGAAPVAGVPGLFLLSGGGTLPPSSTAALPSDSLRLLADAAGRFFTFPGDVRLRTPRARHTETLLPSGRILVVGGVGPGAAVLAQAELIGPN